MNNNETQQHQARPEILGLTMHENGQPLPSWPALNVSGTRPPGSKLSRAAAIEKMRAEAQKIDEACRQTEADLNEKRTLAATQKFRREATKRKMS
jgi:hypothetical protein